MFEPHDPAPPIPKIVWGAIFSLLLDTHSLTYYTLFLAVNQKITQAKLFLNDSVLTLIIKHKKGQAPHSTQILRLPLLPSGPDGVHPIAVAWDPT